ncbi:MAG: nickel-dependent lactate racemase [Candidatus Polarisedimenticolia bacterium]
MLDPGRLARVSLGYGDRQVLLSYDPARFEVLRPAEDGPGELDDRQILERLQAPIGSPPLEELIGTEGRVCLVVPDATRASGSERVCAALLKVLEARGVPAGRIELLVGAGTHRPPSSREIVRIVGEEAARRVTVSHHDAFHADGNVLLGTTSRGTPVEINRRLVDCDHVILVGAIGFHYFAGFSGGRKALLPASASERSIQANHLLAFDRSTLSRTAGVESGRLDGNPVSEDMDEAARIFGPAFLVNTVLDGADRVTALYAGDVLAAHRRGCAAYREAHRVAAPERRPLVIASCGGAPRDINMIQSHKAMEHARMVLEDGGDLILLAACPEGLGRPDFLDWFVPGGADATARMLIHSYKLNGQTAWGIRWKSERYRVRLVSDLPPDAVKRMGMIGHASLDEAIASSNRGPGWILPQALGTLPVLREAKAA